ncbi:MAG: tRNA (guanosine(46)-N7)-methyltransferase TrmB [Lachnospiraceae bacterium]|jgi:tRNA (guanine-N7-)-methyltransferase|nr:tRNA (guanosine(46)-N7)-methyltransferase TrmB [Lachnospiraceae bacterium]
MRLRNIPGAREHIEESIYVVQDYKEQKGHWAEKFGNQNPIYIEVGMGKGQFIYENARRNPDINYVGIEKFSSVVFRAVQKMEEEPLPNLFFIRMEAEEITEVFARGEVAKIYLNFSDPWPKDRHAKRRLPSKEFLGRFAEILVDHGHVEFKTDNKDLFDFALEQREEAGWIMIAHTFDLHHNAEMVEGNIMTEYEERFSAKGNPICKYIIEKP